MNRRSLPETGTYKSGENVFIQPSAILIGENKIEIGDGTWVGSFCNLRPVDNIIKIGKNVLIAQSVSMIADSHQYWDVSKNIKDQGIYGGNIVIDDNVWIGCNSVILHGVKIGCHSVVGAGSIVTKSIPAYCVVAGNPARIIKRYSFRLKKWYKYGVFVRVMFNLKVL